MLVSSQNTGGNSPSWHSWNRSTWSSSSTFRRGRWGQGAWAVHPPIPADCWRSPRARTVRSLRCRRLWGHSVSSDVPSGHRPRPWDWRLWECRPRYPPSRTSSPTDYALRPVTDILLRVNCNNILIICNLILNINIFQK